MAANPPANDPTGSAEEAQKAEERRKIVELFARTAPPAANTFEIALALGGTVSAGAYTAGAVDFLIEALDCWTRLRDGGDAVAPKHRALLKVITGTSGGGVRR